MTERPRDQRSIRVGQRRISGDLSTNWQAGLQRAASGDPAWQRENALRKAALGDPATTQYQIAKKSEAAYKNKVGIFLPQTINNKTGYDI